MFPHTKFQNVDIIVCHAMLIRPILVTQTIEENRKTIEKNIETTFASSSRFAVEKTIQYKIMTTAKLFALLAKSENN